MANATGLSAIQSVTTMDEITADTPPPITDGSDEYTGDDVITGTNQNDEIVAGAGNDFVDGQDGSDSIWGESGDDTLSGGAGEDDLYGGAGSDFLDGEGGSDYLSGQEGNDALLGGEGEDELIGGPGKDSLFGESGRDTLRGGLDPDLLDGGEGDDLLIGGDGNDTVSGGDGIDALFGGTGDDLLAGGFDDDFLDGESGNDTLRGGEGSDLLIGGMGDDSLAGEAGDDQIDGGDGDDTISGGPGEDLLSGGGGFDTVAYRGRREEYSVTPFDEETVVSSQVDGIDVLRNIEKLVFADGKEQIVGDNPWVITSQPSPNGTKVNTDTSIVLEFSEAITAGPGSVIVFNTRTESAVEYVVQDNPAIAISGRSLSLSLTSPLNIFTEYQIQLSAGAVKDSKGLENFPAVVNSFETATVDGLYHFFVVAFAAAPGAIYMGQLGEAFDYFKVQSPADPLKPIVDIFTTKSQFTSVYPDSLSTKNFANQLVANVVKDSATAQAKANAIADIEAAIGIGWTRGDVIYRVFGNLATKPLQDPEWGNTALQFRNQLEVARYLTETLHYASEDVEVLRQSIANVTNLSDVSTIENMVELIGTLPPGV